MPSTISRGSNGSTNNGHSTVMSNTTVLPSCMKPKLLPHPYHVHWASNVYTPTVRKCRRTKGGATMLADTGATHMIVNQDVALINERDDVPGIRIKCANGGLLNSTRRGALPLPTLPTSATSTYRVPELDTSLASIGQVCDAKCTAVFDAREMNVYQNQDLTIIPTKAPVLKGTRTKGGLWVINVPSAEPGPNKKQYKHPVRQWSFRAFSTYEERVIPAILQWVHACLFYPVISTLIEAIQRGWLKSFPGFTVKGVRKYLKPHPSTTTGHFKNVRQNMRSTKVSNVSRGRMLCEDPATISKGGNSYPRQPIIDRCTHVGCVSYPIKELRQMCAADLPGRFPITSARGHKYIYILMNYDTNTIQMRSLKSRKSTEVITAFESCIGPLAKGGVAPAIIRLDNEVSEALTTAIKDRHMDYMLVPPGMHRTNPAERAILTSKNHLIAGLHGADPDFPDDCWDLSLPQGEITINLLRQSRINPQLSAYTQVFGEFDFNRTPLAPFGARVMIHEKPKERGAWADQGTPGFYIRPAMQHYRCYVCYVPRTKGERISDTVQFFTPDGLVPSTTADQLLGVLEDFLEIIQNPDDVPSFEYGTSTGRALRQIQRVLPLPSLTARPSTTGASTTCNCGLPSTNNTITYPHTYPRTTSTWGLPNPTIRNGTRVIRTSTKNKIKKISTNKNKIKNPNTNTTPRDEQNNITTENNKTNSNNNKSTYRPHRMQTRSRTKTLKRKQQFEYGTQVKKWFKTKYYYGSITDYDPVNGFYTILYDDGDMEQFDHDDVRRHIYKKRTTKYDSVALSAHSQNHYIFNIPTAKGTSTPPLHSAFSGSLWDNELGRMASYKDMMTHPNPKIRRRWLRSGENEFGRLLQGYGDVDGLDVLEVIHKFDIPTGKIVTYPRYTIDYRPEKSDPWRTRITTGGDRIPYAGETSTHQASMETIKTMLNSVLSKETARCVTGDISNMYLESDLPEHEFVKFKYELIPPRIIEHYKLDQYVHNGYIYFRVKKAWYGLKQSGKIAHDDLVGLLASRGYHEKEHTPGLFVHETRDIAFALVTDDFLIQVVHDADLQHLIDTIQSKYKFKVDQMAKQFIGINLKWDYKRREVELSMDGYVKQALLEFKHNTPKHMHYGPSIITRPSFGKTTQMVPIDETAPLPTDAITFLRRVVGKFLFYARAIDNTMLHSLNDITIQSSRGTEATMNAVTKFLNYAACHPDARIKYKAFPMILQGDSDAAYLVSPEARSRAGGFHFFGDADCTIFNGPVFVLAKVIRNVMASAAEAEVGALFLNAQELLPIRQADIDLGWPQPATPLKTDNSTANGIINGTIKIKRSKAIDMRFWWLRDRQQQDQFKIYWSTLR